MTAKKQPAALSLIDALVDSHQDIDYLTLMPENVTAGVEVRKPKKHEYVRVHPDTALRRVAPLLCDEENREFYMFDPNLQDGVEDMVRQVLLLPTMTLTGEELLWPLRIPDESGRLDGWSKSAQVGAKTAETQWVRLASNMKAGSYRILVAEPEPDDDPLPEPHWPDRDLGEWLRLAFEGFQLTDPTHPVIRRLRGKLVRAVERR